MPLEVKKILQMKVGKFRHLTFDRTKSFSVSLCFTLQDFLLVADPGLVLLLSCEELELISSSSSSSSSKFILLDIPSQAGRRMSVEGKHVSDISFLQIDFLPICEHIYSQWCGIWPKAISCHFQDISLPYDVGSHPITLNSCGSGATASLAMSTKL